MFKQMKLGAKLITAFLLMALIVTIIGGVGYFSLGRVEKNMDEIANLRLPAVTNLLRMRVAMDEISVSQHSLLNPFLSEKERKMEADKIKESEKRCETCAVSQIGRLT